jgi:hypothetical protein
VNVRSNLAFELDLQARRAKGLIAHGARDPFSFDQRLLECAVRIATGLQNGGNKHTVLLDTGANPTLHSQARQRTTNGAASL